MPARKNSAQQKRSVKRLLDDVLSKKQLSSKIVANSEFTDDQDKVDKTNKANSSFASSFNDATNAASLMLKKNEPTTAKGDQELSSSASSSVILLSNYQTASSREQLVQQSTELATASSEFFYSPMYRRYFGLTPPNPRLCNIRLVEDYIDWYINVYLEEELSWSSIGVGNPSARRRRDEEEVQEEARLTSYSTPKEQ